MYLSFLQALGSEVSSEEEIKDIQEVSDSVFRVSLCSRFERQRERGRVAGRRIVDLQVRVSRRVSPHPRVLKLQQKYQCH
ncbi:hypothetical protein ILYODFUR_020518 [Ilyodon furcidens]|uniref:Uncharacterized protein n=1 Tax=Ilyodon furcidens TaxID=33524 RepID=A0ABV0VFL6_9TELE